MSPLELVGADIATIALGAGHAALVNRRHTGQAQPLVYGRTAIQKGVNPDASIIGQRAEEWIGARDVASGGKAAGVAAIQVVTVGGQRADAVIWAVVRDEGVL